MSVCLAVKVTLLDSFLDAIIIRKEKTMESSIDNL